MSFKVKNITNSNFPKTAFLLSSLISLFPAAYGQATISPQYINFYRENNCNVNSFLETLTQTATVSADNQRASSVAITGLWKLRYNNDTSIIRTERGICYQGSALGVNNLVYATRYGNESQSVSELHLYTDANFEGTTYPVSTTGLNLPNPVTIQSLFFSGSQDWLVFAGSNFTGTSFCFKPEPDVISLGYGFTAQLGPLSRTVGSILFTCDGTGPTSTTFRPNGAGSNFNLDGLIFCIIVGIGGYIFDV